MIKYALMCDRGHDFESWFRDSEAYATQARRGLVACPVCDSVRVSKAIMAPAVAGTRKAAIAAMSAGDGGETPLPVRAPVALLDEKHQRLRAMMRELHTEIMAKSDDVGRMFCTCLGQQRVQ